MEEQHSFQFGVEIELLLGTRKKVHSSWNPLAKDLSKRLQKAGISNHVNEGNDKSQDNYREWSIVQEVTIPSQPAKNLCTPTFFLLDAFTPILEPFLLHRDCLIANFAMQGVWNSSHRCIPFTVTGAPTSKPSSQSFIRALLLPRHPAAAHMFTFLARPCH